MTNIFITMRHISRILVVVISLLIGSLVLPRTGNAQIDFLRLLGGGARASQTFSGQGQLDLATVEAQKGNVAESLRLAALAFQNVDAKEIADSSIESVVASRLLILTKLWEEKGAPPDLVAATLLDVVFPKKSPGFLLLYAVDWRTSTRLDPRQLAASHVEIAEPQSVAAALVQWSVRAKQVAPLQSRLNTCLEASNGKLSALVVSIRLALAQGDLPLAKRQLTELTTFVKTNDSVALLASPLHAVAPALRSLETAEAGLLLLEAALDKVDALAPRDEALSEASAWMRLHAARLHLRAGRKENAAILAKAVAKVSPASLDRDGKDFSQYLQRTRASQTAAVLLEVGLVDEALVLLRPGQLHVGDWFNYCVEWLKV